MSNIPVLDVERALPEESAAALAKFTELNPHWRGAQWADCLDQLDNADANLEVTEPLWETLSDEGFIDDARRPYINLVTLTLLYSSPEPVTPQRVRIGVNMTLAYLGLIEGEWNRGE